MNSVREADVAPESRRPGRLAVVLNVEGLMPRELRVVFTDSGGAHSALECDWLGRRYRCEGDLRGRGQSRVRVSLRARSGRVVSVGKRLHLNGDEEEAVVRGTIGGDSLGHLDSHTYRSPNPGVTLDLVALQDENDLTSFQISNGAAEEIIVTTQGHVLGALAHFGRDRRWHDMRRTGTACATGMGQSTLAPGESAPAYVSTHLRHGTYLFDVNYDDSSTRDDPEVTRRITTRFEVGRPTRAR